MGTVGAQHEHGLIPIGEGNTVDPGPDMAKTAGRELHTRGEAEFGVARKLGVGLAVVKEVLIGNMPLHRGNKVLGRNTVSYGNRVSSAWPRALSRLVRTCLVEQNRDIVI